MNTITAITLLVLVLAPIVLILLSILAQLCKIMKWLVVGGTAADLIEDETEFNAALNLPLVEPEEVELEHPTK
jgi:hypothetical protein